MQIKLNKKLYSNKASAQVVLKWSISNFQGRTNSRIIFSSRVESTGKLCGLFY